MKIRWFSNHTYNDYFGRLNHRFTAEVKNGRVMWLSTGSSSFGEGYRSAAMIVATAFAKGGKVGAIMAIEALQRKGFMADSFHVVREDEPGTYQRLER